MKELYAEKLIIDEDWLEYIAKSTVCKYNFLIGSYRSSKTTFNIFCWGTYLAGLDFDGIHLVLASSASVAKTLVEDNAGFGLQDFFYERYTKGKYKDFDAGFINNPKGHKQIILYMGHAKQNSYTLFRGMSFTSIMVEESNIAHENSITEIKGRLFASKKPRYFFSTNPGSDKTPDRVWLKELMANVPDQVNFARKSIWDNPALSVERVNEIVSEYDPNSLFFKRYLQGDDASAEGLIYHLEDKNYIDEVSKGRYLDYIVVIDPGKTTSATAAIAMGRNIIEKTVDVLYEFHHKNNVNMTKVYTSTDYAQLLSGFIKDCTEQLGRWPKVVIIDSFAGDDAYENLRKEFIKQHIPTQIKFPVKANGSDGKDECETRITRCCDLLLRGKLRINRKCKHTIEDFSTAVYDEKALEKGKEIRKEEFNAEGHADMLDCVEYANSYYTPQLNYRDWR